MSKKVAKAAAFKKATHRRPIAPSDRRLVSELRQAIEKSDMPWAEVARRAGLSETVVTRFMAGETDISLSRASRIVEVLDLHLTGTSASQT